MGYTTTTLRSLDDLLGALTNEIKWQEFHKLTLRQQTKRGIPTDPSRFTRYGLNVDSIKGSIELINSLSVAGPISFFVSDIRDIDLSGEAFPHHYPKLAANYFIWVPPVQTANQEGRGLYSCGNGVGNTREEVMRNVRAHAGADIVSFYRDLSQEGWEERVPFFINKEWQNERQIRARDYLLKVVVTKKPMVLAK